MRRSRNLYRGMMLLVVSTMMTAGCRKELPSRTEDGRIPVRVFLLLISTAQIEYYRWAEATFEKENPNIDVIIEQFPGSSLKDFEIKLRLRFSSGRPPDVFHLQDVMAMELAPLGLLDEAPPAIAERVETNSLNALVRDGATYDGKLYGIVSDAVWTALYYNKDMFREAGLDPDRPPATWEELVEMADTLTVRGPDGMPIRAGFSLRKSGYKGGTAGKWLTFLFSAGGHAINETGTRAMFNSEAGVEALELYDVILNERHIDSVALEGDQQGFGQERVAMFIREAHVIPWLRENYPNLDFGVAPIPRQDTSISSAGTYQFSVAEQSPNKEAAWKFVEFLTSDGPYTRYVTASGSLPTMASVARQPQFAEDPHLAVFLNQEAKSPGNVPRVGRAMDILGAYIERFAYGHLTAEETLERAARDVNAVLSFNETEAP